MKKVVALITVAMLLFGLVACNTGGNSGSTSGTSGDASGSGDNQVLKVAALESAYGSEVWQEIKAAFEEVKPGVTVELTVDRNLEDVIDPAMRAGDYPDVIHLAQGREAALTDTFIKDKNLEDITDVLSMTIPGENGTVQDKIIPEYLETNLTMPYGDDKTYLLPMFYTTTGLYYNAGLLREKGWDVPTTWDEMWELGDKAKAEGIALFTYPTTGYFDTFFFGLLSAAGGPEFFERAMRYEEGIWETPEAQEAFDIVNRLATEYTEATVPANANDENFTRNQQLILDNKAIFMPNGSWVVDEMADAPRADGFEWASMGVPATTEGGDSYAVAWFEQAWMPAGAQNKELGKEFMAFLYSDTAASIFAQHGAAQPVLGIVDDMSEENQVFYRLFEEGTIPVLGGWAATNPIEGLTNREVWFDPINSLVTGDKTEEEWVNDIIAASDRFRAELI